jgi:sugar/nucleoside kinase (ribokinase family)
VFFQYQPIGAQVNVKRVLALADDSVKRGCIGGSPAGSVAASRLVQQGVNALVMMEK